MRGIYLYINTNKGDILLPFKNIKKMDSFTLNFNDPSSLAQEIFNILGIALDIDDVLEVAMLSKYKKPKQNVITTKKLPIKYRGDNYKEESVKEQFAKYLKQDRKRIKYSDIRFVTTRGMVGFLGGVGISDSDIDYAVNSYFANDSYKKIRDVYFLIKDVMQVKIDSLDRKDITDTKEENEYDDYIQYLSEVASRNDDEERAMAMDELAKFSLSELSRVFKDNAVGLFEGLDYHGKYVRQLEEATGMSVEQLKKMTPSFSLSKGRKR